MTRGNTRTKQKENIPRNYSISLVVRGLGVVFLGFEGTKVRLGGVRVAGCILRVAELSVEAEVFGVAQSSLAEEVSDWEEVVGVGDEVGVLDVAGSVEE